MATPPTGILRGRCLCGAVRYGATGPARDMWYCHCRACAKETGSGFGTWIEVPGVDWESGAGERRKRADEAGGWLRSHCAICASRLPGERADGTAALLPAGGLEAVHGLRPTHHEFTADRLPWLPALASLPAFPAARDPADRSRAASRLEPTPAPRAPELPVRGSCLCGAIAFELASPPFAMRVCHCSRCRRRSGSSYFVALACAPSGLRFLSGEASIRRWQHPEAARYAVSSCAECGGPAPSAIGQSVFVNAGTLDTDPGVRTRAHLFHDSRAPWIGVADGLPRFAAYPPQGFDWTSGSAS